jgi:hypothetical protein
MINWLMALLLLAPSQVGGKMGASDLLKPSQMIPRIDAEQCSALSKFAFHLKSEERLSEFHNRVYISVANTLDIDSMDMNSLAVRKEFLFGEFTNPNDPDCRMRILVKMANLGAAFGEFMLKGGYLYPPEKITRKDVYQKWLYDTFKGGLDRLEQDYPPKYNLVQILREIHTLPEAEREERRMEWYYKLEGDASRAVGAGRESAGMVGPDGRFMWRGVLPNFDEIFGVGDVFTRKMETHALREAGSPKKQGGLERIRPAFAQAISPDGRWGFQYLLEGSRSLAFYDMKALKVAWTIHRKWETRAGSFSPDGKHFLVYGRGPIGIYDLEKQCLDRERWTVGLEMDFSQEREKGSGFTELKYAEFSPKGRYLVAIDNVNGDHNSIYDIQTDAMMKAIPKSERIFRGWGPVEHTAFFLEAHDLVLRDIRDGERLLALNFPAQLDMKSQEVNRLFCPPGKAGIVLVSFTDSACLNHYSSPRPCSRVARWDLNVHLGVLKQQVDAKGH